MNEERETTQAAETATEPEPSAAQAAEEEKLPPYVIEGARSSRSKCKACRRAINKGALRLGVMIVGPYGTGYLWHHLTCAARKRMDNVEEAYELKAWENAKEVPESIPPIEELRKLRENAEQRRKARKTIPYVEPAPSGRARCKHCEQIIEKGSLRVVLGRGVYFGSQVRTTPINIHPRCVSSALEAEDCTTEAPGFHDAVRTNSSDIPSEQVERVLAKIGELPD